MRTLLTRKPLERAIHLPAEVNFVPQHWADRYLEKLWRCRAGIRTQPREQLALRLRLTAHRGAH